MFSEGGGDLADVSRKRASLHHTGKEEEGKGKGFFPRV